MDVHVFDLAGKPQFETNTGREIGMASLRQEKVLAFQFLVILYDPTDGLLHGVVIASEKSPVDPFPVLGRGGP
jgi:hypothetical protein